MPSDFTQVPHTSTRASREPRVLKTQFGDGYVQATTEGINTAPLIYNLVFKNLTRSELDTIDTFLAGKKGHERFTWTPPDPHNVEISVICEKWRWTYEHGTIIGMSATFEQRFYA